MSTLRLIFSAFRIALRALARGKLRAALTILGILIGISAVVIVIALGAGAREKISQQIASLGANTIYIFPQSAQASGARSKGGGRLTELDGRALVREATSVVAVAPYLSSTAQVVWADHNVAVSIMGTNRDYFRVRDYKIAKGSVWSEQDERTKGKSVIIGTTTAENLFGNQDPIGVVIRIGRHPYRIVGLLERKGPGPFGEDQDDRILMPIGTFRARVRPTSPGRVDMLMASASDAQTVERAQAQIESILRQRHRIEELRQPDFSIRTQAEFRRSQETVYNVLSVLLLSVAAVSLIVGGIGVMNIMLVSVVERTREIGIRMAIGATQGDIQIQFLVEAVVLALLGGVAGSVLGLGGVYAFAIALDWPMRLPVSALGFALFTSATLGVVFGLLPARRAARLDPIEALRQE